MTRFIVNVSDALSDALDTVSEVTGASRSGVLAVLIRVHIQQLIRFMNHQPTTVNGGKAVVTVEETGDSVEAQFLEGCATYPHELELLVKAFGLTHTLDR